MEDITFKVLSDKSYRLGTSIESDGVHFGCLTSGEERPVLLLYRKGTEEIVREIPFPEDGISGHFYSMKVKIRPSAYEYNYREASQVFTDPCARKIAGRSLFGELPSGSAHAVRGGFVWKKFDWEDDQYPNLSYS